MAFVASGILTAIGTTFFYAAYRQSSRINSLEGTPYTKISDVNAKLKENNDQPLLLKLTGAIQSDAPELCEFTPNLSAAIIEKTVEGQWATIFQQEMPQRYIESKSRRLSKFYISDGKTGSRVYISPWDEYQPVLKLSHEALTEGNSMLLSFILGRFGYRYPYKIVTSERILPLNQQLLAFGKVYKDGNGDLILKKADSGFFIPTPPAMLSVSSEQDILDNLKDSRRQRRIFGSGFTLSGLGVFCYGMYKRQ